MDGLNLNELEQVATSNFLLYVALKLLWAAFLCKVPGTLENPKEPRNKSRPSVWRLPWLKLLRDQGHLCQHLIWQAHYGARSPKPTNLGTVHLPHSPKSCNCTANQSIGMSWGVDTLRCGFFRRTKSGRRWTWKALIRLDVGVLWFL